MRFENSVYRNGNYVVISTSSGSRRKICLRSDEEFNPEFPDSIDLKISNRCSINCPYCHEESEINGKLANINEIKRHLSSLPNKPIEVAIGGGNLLEDKESISLLMEVTSWLQKEKKMRASLTINETSLRTSLLVDPSTLKNLKNLNLSGGLGVSLGPNITSDRLDCIQRHVHVFSNYTIPIVYHIILGKFPIDLLEKILNDTFEIFGYGTTRILFLGYKQFGRAKDTPLPDTIPRFETLIKSAILQKEMSNMTNISKSMMSSRLVLGFDNLAIEQINLRGSFTQLDFENIYQGPEFSCSMYVDAVNGQYAKNSTYDKDKRINWNEVDIIDYFTHDKIKKNN